MLMLNPPLAKASDTAMSLDDWNRLDADERSASAMICLAVPDFVFKRFVERQPLGYEIVHVAVFNAGWYRVMMLTPDDATAMLTLPGVEEAFPRPMPWRIEGEGLHRNARPCTDRDADAFAHFASQALCENDYECWDEAVELDDLEASRVAFEDDLADMIEDDLDAA